MFNFVYTQLQQKSPSAVVILSLAMMLLGGYGMTRITKKCKLPNVTAYILCGILIGPFGLNLIPREIVDGSEFLADIALAFIAFSTGEFFRFSKLRDHPGKVVVITLCEALLASVLVFLLTRFVLRLNLAFSIVLAALASATAPASTMMTIRQTKAKGDFVDTLLQVVAYDDIVALLAYSVAISVAVSSVSGEPISAWNLVIPVLKNIGGLLLGGLFGLFTKILIQNRRSSDNRLIIAIAMLFSFCGVCSAMGISPLLGCMSMGTVYINITNDDQLFKQLNYFSPPILLLFFVRSGISFDLRALIRPTGSIAGVPLFVVGISYFLIRILGKYTGAYLGCACAGKPKETRNYFGLALIPQAGVAIGLAALGSRALGGEMGDALETVILSSSVLYELIGPACAKLALFRSKSYPSTLTELVAIAQSLPEESAKSSLERLTERIEQLQAELARSSLSEEERAFLDAAEEQSAESSSLC